MAVREDEAIAIGPDRILRIEAQDAIPDRIDQWRERHRRAGVSGFGLLHRVDRKRANGVDAQLIEFRVRQMVHSSCRAHVRLLSLLTFVSSDATLARRRRWRSGYATLRRVKRVERLHPAPRSLARTHRLECRPSAPDQLFARPLPHNPRVIIA